MGPAPNVMMKQNETFPEGAGWVIKSGHLVGSMQAKVWEIRSNGVKSALTSPYFSRFQQVCIHSMEGNEKATLVIE